MDAYRAWIIYGVYGTMSLYTLNQYDRGIPVRYRGPQYPCMGYLILVKGIYNHRLILKVK